ncbi:hypothetical protein RJ639_031238 [Escallonia herrerae]|uniref:Uncharacterized protein n=1 Tax=Escallonia herrerae TaxID=1293975 RepID=A0AA88X0Y5_9ASTE|nr:hypothetical protein RJ639_031238 [Escallonia herrerae]
MELVPEAVEVVYGNLAEVSRVVVTCRRGCGGRSSPGVSPAAGVLVLRMKVRDGASLSSDSKNLENGGNQNSLGERNKKVDYEEEWELAEQRETAGEMLIRGERNIRGGSLLEDGEIEFSVTSSSMSDLEAVLTAIIDRIFSHRSAEPGSASLQETVHISGYCKIFKRSRRIRWCNLLPSVRKFLGSLLMPSDPGSQVPRLLHSENIDSSVLLLREEYAWHLGGALSQLELDDWKLLYHKPSVVRTDMQERNFPD